MHGWLEKNLSLCKYFIPRQIYKQKHRPLHKNAGCYLSNNGKVGDNRINSLSYLFARYQSKFTTYPDLRYKIYTCVFKININLRDKLTNTINKWLNYSKVEPVVRKLEPQK